MPEESGGHVKEPGEFSPAGHHSVQSKQDRISKDLVSSKLGLLAGGLTEWG